MIGWNSEGKLVNFNHKCACGERTPLPEMDGKHCPNCGVMVVNHSVIATKQLEQLNTCPGCGCSDEKGNYCKNCGKKLK